MRKTVMFPVLAGLLTCMGASAEAQQALRLPSMPLATRQDQSTQTAAPRRDTLLNGVLIGALIGGLVGLIPDHYDDCEECHDSLYGSIAVGAGIGLVIDALHSRSKPVTPSIAGIPVQVSAGRRGVRARAVIRWR